MNQPPIPCHRMVHWWDGEYEGECELAQGHDGPHYDGLSWWDDDGDEVAEPATREPRSSEDDRGPSPGASYQQRHP